MMMDYVDQVQQTDPITTLCKQAAFFQHNYQDTHSSQQLNICQPKERPAYKSNDAPISLEAQYKPKKMDLKQRLAIRTQHNKIDDSNRRNTELAAIYILKTRLEMDDKSYRDVLYKLTEQRSSVALTHLQRRRVLAYLYKLHK